MDPTPLQAVTVSQGPGDKCNESPGTLRFRGQALSPVYKPVRPTPMTLSDKSTYKAATTAAIGCSLLLSSLILVMLTGTYSAGTVALSTDDGTRRHEIHLKPLVQNSIAEALDVEAYQKSAASKEPVAILYTVFGAWSDEVEWEFKRLVAHVCKTPLLSNHDVVLLWETPDSAEPQRSPTASAGLQALMQSNPRVRLFHAVALEAAQRFPPTSFQHGFYYNPEVAAIMFLSQNPQYRFVWLLESDVRWTVSVRPCRPPRVRGRWSSPAHCAYLHGGSDLGVVSRAGTPAHPNCREAGVDLR